MAGSFGTGIKLIQRGEKTLGSADTADTITITAVDTAKAIISHFSCTTAGSQYVPRIVLTNTTTLTLTRSTSGQDSVISWEVAEYY